MFCISQIRFCFLHQRLEKPIYVFSDSCSYWVYPIYDGSSRWIFRFVIFLWILGRVYITGILHPRGWRNFPSFLFRRPRFLSFPIRIARSSLYHTIGFSDNFRYVSLSLICLHKFGLKCILLHIFGNNKRQLGYYLVWVEVIGSTSYGTNYWKLINLITSEVLTAYLISWDPNMPEKYKYPLNDPFLERRHSKVFRKRHGEFFEVVIFSHNSLQNQGFFYFYFFSTKVSY